MEQGLKEIVRRIDKLERAVFGRQKAKRTSAKSYSGPAGGVALLFDKGYFNKKRGAAEVKKELESENYHYTLAAVQTALNRASTRTGPLTSFREDGKKGYVRRK